MTAQPFSYAGQHMLPAFLVGAHEMEVLTAIWQKIVCHAVELLELDDCALAVVDVRGLNLLPLTIAPLASASIQTAPSVLTLRTGPLAAVTRQQTPLILEDIYLDAQLQPCEMTRTLFCLPLFDADQLLGALLASKTTPLARPTRDLDLLALLAEQATLALTNVRQAEFVRDAKRLKASFLSLVTHELRSPLNAINGYLDLVLEGMAGELNEQQREFIQRARAGSERLYASIEDLLLASRADAGQLRLSHERVDLRELTRNAFEELELTASDAKVSLKTLFPQKLPAVVGDPVRLQQVLRNLLVNALHSTPPGGRVTVTARVRHSKLDKLEVSVGDTGIGIAAEYHTRIFERFFQVPPLDGGRSSGQGLGLAIVKAIVELHGGQVRVISVPEKGSTFLFTLNILQ